ncbi:MAG TPA: hypothetical protein VFO41_16185 [Alphaproteobacteria bacterium]|nr:hypothetical protein [Alphaproteobacteria bacterium]
MTKIALAEIDNDIRARYARNMGKFSSFFLNWLKFENNSDKLFQAVGSSGENYLQFRLRQHDVMESLIVMETACAYWKPSHPERVYGFLNHEDGEGNGIWHYLADTLRQNEGRETLKMARTLLALDISFARLNRKGISPLGKMLLPTPKWQSLNALIATKHLSMENIEQAVAEQAKEKPILAHFMSQIFSSDLADNRGLLSQHVLKQSVAVQSDNSVRAATCRLFFDYVDVQDNTTAFFKLIANTNHGMFDDLLRLLLLNTEETLTAMAPPDVATKKAYRQAILCRRLLLQDKQGEGILFKALAAEKHAHMRKLTSLLLNDDLAIRKLVRGEPVRQPLVVDKTSPAPSNPLLSLLLQKNRLGNTIFHQAVLAGDQAALEGFFYNMPSNDVYAIMTGIPNRGGLTLVDLTSPGTAKPKLIRAAQAGRITGPGAQDMMRRVLAVPEEMRTFITGKVTEIEALAADTGHGAAAPLPPGFDLAKAAAVPAQPARTGTA